MNLLSPDSKFMRAMSLLGDLIVLNLVFLLCCVPVLTVGAAVTALDTAAFRLVRGMEGRVLEQFFRAFRLNFRRATAVWLLLLLVGAVAVLDIWIFAAFTGILKLIEIPFVLLLLLALFTAGYAFPLLSQFDNTVRATLKNGLILSLGFLPRTLMITVLNAFPFALLFLSPYMFLKTGFFWVFFYFAIVAYLNAKLLEKVFAPYREEKEAEGS